MTIISETYLKGEFMEKKGNIVGKTIVLKNKMDYEFVNNDPNLLDYIEDYNHLCFKCANAYPDKCQKVCDIGKNKFICKYDFVTDGFQIFLDNNYSNYKKLIITKCDNFIPD